MTKRSRSRMIADTQATQVQNISEIMHGHLKGLDANVQGALLADLTAIWLAGHVHFDDEGEIARAETGKMRAELLAFQTDQIRKLIAVNELPIIAELKRRKPK